MLKLTPEQRSESARNAAEARWAKANVSPAGGRFSHMAYWPTLGFRCVFSDATIGAHYRIQVCTSLVEGVWSDYADFTYSVPVLLTPPPVPDRFYRAVTP